MSAQPSHINRQTNADGICTLTFDRVNSSANIFDRAALEQLDEHLTAIAADPQVRGLLVESAKKSIFIAGADLRSLMLASAEKKLDDFIAFGQQVFNKLAALSVPTIAVIHGATAGGGYEFTLACDYRLASTDRLTRIGLPETQIGLLPAWGGASRLPRLIGLPRAAEIILKGQLLGAAEALQAGLVDEIAPRENLREMALKKITAGKPQRPAPASDTADPTLALPKVNRADYPAPFKALEVMKAGITVSMTESLKLERKAIVELAATETCRNLVRLFFLTERSRKLQIAGVDPCPESKITRTKVIGAGLMGSGIAQWLSLRGLSVVLSDLSETILVQAQTNIKKTYEASVKRGLINEKVADEGLARISYDSGNTQANGFDLIVEAAVEKMDVKKAIFQQLGANPASHSILATNTSALSISAIGDMSNAPNRVAGLHFFNPVARMKLVEVVQGEKSDLALVQRLVRFVQEIGKLPVVVRDSPGFLVNRVLFCYLLEAVQLFEMGVPAKEIEKTMLDFGMPMGPLRLIDEIGLDICQDIAGTLSEKLGVRYSSTKILSRMIETGLLGRKNNQGFYIYSDGKSEMNKAAESLAKGKKSPGLASDELQTRLISLIVNETALCLEEKIIGAPEDADFSLLMGIGFPSFRGGPLRYAEHVGVKKVTVEMERLAKSDKKFLPCSSLREKAKRGENFYENSI